MGRELKKLSFFMKKLKKDVAIIPGMCDNMRGDFSPLENVAPSGREEVNIVELGAYGVAVWMVSSYGAKKIFADGFETEWEAREYASMFGWEYTDENGFCWNLEV